MKRNSNILMQRTEGSVTVYAKSNSRINSTRPLTLVKKHSAAPDQGVRFWRTA